MALRLYADECVDARIVAGLRRRGVDIVSAHDEGLLGATDEGHLERAASLGRVVLTADHDFLRMASERANAGGSHPGLVFILPRTDVGDAIRGALLVAEALDPADLLNRIEWVP
jgi:predicted nuclease of predicted toxin-antitoxin system